MGESRLRRFLCLTIALRYPCLAPGRHPSLPTAKGATFEAHPGNISASPALTELGLFMNRGKLERRPDWIGVFRA